MKKLSKVRIKSIINYLSTCFTWTVFCILIICAGFLAYYYVCINLSGKNSNYKPPFSIYTIISGSMIPTINVYDVIINLKIDSPAAINIGDVITFISDGASTDGYTITHRVKDIQVVNGKYQYVTKGDNNVVADPTPAAYNKVIGRTVVRLPKLGRVQYFIASKFGWLAVIVTPALIIIIKDILKIIKLSKIKKDADEINKKVVSDSTN